jgi:hypothetical protein
MLIQQPDREIPVRLFFKNGTFVRVDSCGKLRYYSEQVTEGESFRSKGMINNIVRKDIEFHVNRYDSMGMPIGVIIAKPVTIFFDENEISDEEVRKIIDSHRSDISNCICDDARMVVMTTPMAELLIQNAGQRGISLSAALQLQEDDENLKAG